MTHYQKKKGGFFKKVLSVILCIFIAGSSLYLCTEYLDDAETFFLKAFYPIKYSNYVKNAAENYNLEEALIYSVIKTESNFNPDADSNAGAKGIMQIMPKSFEWMQKLRKENLNESELYNPETNIDYGCYLLRYFLDFYRDERCAVAAYNAGFVVSGWLSNEEYSSDGKTLDSIPYNETSNYVEKVEKAKEMYIKLYFSEN